MWPCAGSLCALPRPGLWEKGEEGWPLRPASRSPGPSCWAGHSDDNTGRTVTGDWIAVYPCPFVPSRWSREGADKGRSTGWQRESAGPGLWLASLGLSRALGGGVCNPPPHRGLLQMGVGGGARGEPRSATAPQPTSPGASGVNRRDLGRRPSARAPAQTPPDPPSLYGSRKSSQSISDTPFPLNANCLMGNPWRGAHSPDVGQDRLRAWPRGTRVGGGGRTGLWWRGGGAPLWEQRPAPGRWEQRVFSGAPGTAGPVLSPDWLGSGNSFRGRLGAVPKVVPAVACAKGRTEGPPSS